MDALDRKIVELLRDDGKLTIAQLAEAVNRSTTPVHERVKKLERDGVIIGYSARVNPTKLGLGLTAFCEVSLQTHEFDMLRAFEAEIDKLVEIVECHHIAGSFDYLLKIQTKDIAAYQEFLSQELSAVPHIGRIQSAFAMKKVKGRF